MNARQDGMMKLVMNPDWYFVDKAFTKKFSIPSIPVCSAKKQVVRVLFNLTLFAHIKPPFDERFKVHCSQQSPRRVIGLEFWQNLQYLS